MKKILTVDDEASVLNVLKKMLGDRGYQVCATSNPLEIGRMLEDERPDLLILDVHMPEKDGLTLFRELKQHDRLLPVLFVTGYPNVFSVASEPMMKMWQEYFGDGNVDILYKPFLMEDLYEKVEMLIGPSAD